VVKAAVLASLAYLSCAFGGTGGADDGTRGAIEVTVRYDFSRGTYAEGALAEIVVVRAGKTVFSKRTARAPTEGQLAPSRYRLNAALRPCDGNCDRGLDPPVDDCSLAVVIPTDGVLRVRALMSPGRRCRLAVSEKAPAGRVLGRSPD